MRKLAMVCFAFAAAIALGVYVGYGVWLAGIGAACVTAGSIALLFEKKDWLKRTALLLLGFGMGAVYCHGYAMLRVVPLEKLSGTVQTLNFEVLEQPRATDYGCSVVTSVRVKEINTRAVLYLEKEQPLSPGDIVTANVKLQHYSENDNTALGLYYQSRDISLRCIQSGEVKTVQPDTLPVKLWPSLLAEKLKDSINSCFSGRTAGLMQALLTGDRSELNPQTQSDFTRSGIMHTIAISGMHVSVLLTLVFFLLGGRRKLVSLVGIPIVFVFMAMVGFTPSVVRAGIMQTMLMLAPLLKRENDAPTSLSFSLLILLLWNPWSIASASLQLSFSAMAGIFLITGPVYKNLVRIRMLQKRGERSRIFKKLWDGAATILATSLGAMIFTAPLCALHFGTVSISALLTNLLVLWAVSICFMLGLIASAIGIFWAAAGRILGFPASLLARYILFCARWVAKIPYSSVNADDPYILRWLVFAYLLIGAFLLLRGRKRPVILCCCLILSLLSSLWLSGLDNNRGTASITALDVGQGQCVILSCEDFTAMVDCGGSDGDGAGDDAAEFLEQSGKLTLDILVLTHYDKDHTGGIVQLLYRIGVKTLYLPNVAEDSEIRKTIEQAACDCGTDVVYVDSDTTISSQDNTLKIYAPVSFESDNAASLAVLLQTDVLNALVTGDMNTAAESDLLRHTTLPDLDVLVAGHHGSVYSTSEALLECTAPEAVLISVGENHYGQPAEPVLERIKACGALCYRTDLCGNITIRR